MPKDIIRIIEPLSKVYSNPDKRLRFLTSCIYDNEKFSYYTKINYENIIHLFSKHNKDDVPPFNKYTVEELLKHLDKGTSVYQYNIKIVPNYWKIKNELWIYEKKIAEIKGVSLRSVYNMRRSGKLTFKRIVLYDKEDSCKRVYIRPDDYLIYWCTNIEDPSLLIERFRSIKYIMSTWNIENIDDLYNTVEELEIEMEIFIEGISISKSLDDRKSVKHYFNKLFGDITLDNLKTIMNDTNFVAKLVGDAIRSLYGSVTPPQEFIDNLCVSVGITMEQFNSIDVSRGMDGDINDIKLRQLASLLLKLEEEKVLSDIGI